MSQREEIYQYIGAKIAFHRKLKKIKQEELGKFIGLKRSTIAQIESGRLRISIDKLYQIVKIFNIKLLDILPEVNDTGLKFDSISEERITKTVQRELRVLLENLSHDNSA